MGWKPTIGKWDDEDHYDMKEPLWRTMLNYASKFEEVKDVQQTIRWLNSKNLYNDLIRIYTIGYVLHKKNVDIKKEFNLSDKTISKINDFSQRSNNISEYTILVMKECNVSDEIIAEFEIKRITIHNAGELSC
ncbi:MAG: hypothetical protein IJ493_13340 [Clostridia bacterium]|nr:hypothetical protein [Clostridia bacterium]